MTIQISPARINNNATSFKGGAPKLWIIKSENLQKRLTEWGNFSTPQNRILMGATALAIQPEIDWHNKKVDEKTRKVSTARTISKIAVGTATGYYIRKYSIKWMDKFTMTPKDLKDAKKAANKWNTLLVPTSVTSENYEKVTRLLGKHRKALGSIAALVIMLVTNFAIDAPLTKFFTNLLTSKMDAAGSKKSVDKGGK